MSPSSSRIVGCNAIVLVDSEAAEGALVKGCSSSGDIGSMCGLFWALAVYYEVHVYSERVPTDGNRSGGPFRADLGEVLKFGAVPIPSAHLHLAERLDSWEKQAGKELGNT